MLALAGCSSGDNFSSVASPTSGAALPSVTSTTTTTPSPSTSTSTTAASEVTVRGVVGQALASARVVVLAQPVSGFANVALTDATEVVRAGGGRASLTDLTPGVTVEISGRPGTPGTLVARRITVL